ncbi:hypothetical protein HZH68_014842 [Vespula germanica]|uniref:Cadherin domain-containing protein n=1 Tax=Vespula germanica TaxID=30212 RepID=A0A834J9T0_VESGE|nr:hypothetical protein HZH68_014842 [Vespula germanica]
MNKGTLGNNVNEPPILEAGGYPTGLPLSESTKVGTSVFVLKGYDPEGSPVKYGIQLTDYFVVDSRTGAIKLAKPLNREILENPIYMYYNVHRLVVESAWLLLIRLSLRESNAPAKTFTRLWMP